MRFTLCDFCVCASEALDRVHSNGGRGWKTAQMEVTKRGLDGHYKVPVRQLRMTQLLQAIVRQCTLFDGMPMFYCS